MPSIDEMDSNGCAASKFWAVCVREQKTKIQTNVD